MKFMKNTQQTSTTPLTQVAPTSVAGISLDVLRSQQRGYADHGWLKSRHTFSFADYYNPDLMAFRSLRVINEDYIDGGTGFGSHPHSDMEIITYIVEGSLEHKDSMGNRAVVKPGEVQRMTAGTGVTHSEYNFEPDKKTHLLQIWITPNQKGMKPGYGQQNIEQRLNDKKFMLAVSGDGREGSIDIAQDADLYVGRLNSKDTMDFKVNTDRHIWVQLVKGSLGINGFEMSAGDALAVSPQAAGGSGQLNISAIGDAEFLLFDLA